MLWLRLWCVRLLSVCWALTAAVAAAHEVRESGEQAVTTLTPVSPAPLPSTAATSASAAAATWMVDARLASPAGTVTTAAPPPQLTEDGFKPSTHLGDYFEHETSFNDRQPPRKYLLHKFKSFAGEYMTRTHKDLSGQGLGAWADDGGGGGGEGAGWRPAGGGGSTAADPDTELTPPMTDAGSTEPSTEISSHNKKRAMLRAMWWGRTARALATLLPAGLLLAALSPSVITVAPAAPAAADALRPPATTL